MEMELLQHPIYRGIGKKPVKIVNQLIRTTSICRVIEQVQRVPSLLCSHLLFPGQAISLSINVFTHLERVKISSPSFQSLNS